VNSKYASLCSGQTNGTSARSVFHNDADYEGFVLKSFPFALLARPSSISVVYEGRSFGSDQLWLNLSSFLRREQINLFENFVFFRHHDLIVFIVNVIISHQVQHSVDEQHV